MAAAPGVILFFPGRSAGMAATTAPGTFGRVMGALFCFVRLNGCLHGYWFSVLGMTG